MVNVVEKEVEGNNALGQATFDDRPFGAGDDAWKQIIGENALCALVCPIDSKGDALMEKGGIGGLLALIAIYFVGAEQGATSLISGTWVHEFTHDGRHLLGFPCH